jgi:glyoxylase-like metal-dependent hydrolase (beta-lactamase superfamily II)
VRTGARLTLFAAGTVVGIATAIAWSSVGVARAQDGRAGIEVLQVRPNFHMIAGAGGNIGVQVGLDGVLLVNTGNGQASDEVIAAIRRLTNQPIRYIINTSADADLVGGNTALSRAGRHVATPAVRPAATPSSITGTDLDVATIWAQDNVLSRLSAPSAQQAFPSSGWPSESFGRRRWMYFNDEGIEMVHLPAAHSDGDSVVFFRRSDVVVAGHILDTTRFPVIDLARGGGIQGEIDALNRLLELAIPIGPYMGTPSGANHQSELPGGTEVLPGRGRIFRQGDLVNYRDMIVVIRDTVQDMIGRKMSLDEIKAAAPAKPWAPQYGATTGPWTTNDFVEAVYRSLTDDRTRESERR